MAKRTKAAADPRAKLLDAAFKSAIRDGWQGLRVAELAKTAGITVAEAYKIAPDRPGLLDAYVSGIDAGVAEQLLAAPGEEDANWRDIAFDGLMMRFDAMLKDRDALRVIYFDDQRDVIALARSAQRTHKSLGRILEASRFAKDSLALQFGAAALVPLYARLYRTWLNDEEDQARTMAALDKALIRLERLKGRFTGRPVSKPKSDDAPEPPEAAGTDHTTH